LRLNGFLLIQDYVLHVDFSHEVAQLREQQRDSVRDLRTQGLNDRQIREQLGAEWEPSGSADCDLLAIRLPHTHETINGEPLAYDDKYFRKRGYRLNTDTIGLIVEVKTGDGEAAASNVVFTRRGLQTALRRLGLFP
jgi:hypothetical protein